ncbi:MAG: RnfH family protein [Spongiibacteraceae bacterium]|jgi:putative ubiquitin-RnfH superfamily antitoxin RatB of RatAB toxin-antitoxin module|nr:RnfH family protein [Spongiibacteraceae bacterium]
MSTATEQITVEVAYALPDRHFLRAIRVPAGTTLQEAVVQSGVAQQFPELDLNDLRLGVFGKVAKRDQVVSDGDRIEIYRPLLADPKEVRRARAARQG